MDFYTGELNSVSPPPSSQAHSRLCPPPLHLVGPADHYTDHHTAFSFSFTPTLPIPLPRGAGPGTWRVDPTSPPEPQSKEERGS